MKRLACVSLLMMAMGSGAAFAQAADGLVPYAQIRAYTGWLQQSASVTQQRKEKDLDFVEQLGLTRVGVKGKFGNIDGLVELGTGSQNSSAGLTVVTRKAYAQWNQSEDFNVRIGQDEAPYTFYSSCITLESAYNGWGNTAQLRDMQIKLTYLGAYIDFLSPVAPGAITYIDGSAKSTSAKNWDLLGPKTAVGYDFTSSDKNIFAGFGAVYQASVFDGLTTAALDGVDDKRVDSGLVYAHVSLKAGDFTIKLNGGYGLNPGIIGVNYSAGIRSTLTSVNTSSTSSNTFCVSGLPEINAAANGFKNTTSIEGFLELNYDLGFADFRGGVGYVSADNSNWKKKDEQMAYFAQAIIPVVEKRFNIIPEIAYFDFMKDKTGNAQGNELAGGMLLQLFL